MAAIEHLDAPWLLVYEPVPGTEMLLAGVDK